MINMDLIWLRINVINIPRDSLSFDSQNKISQMLHESSLTLVSASKMSSPKKRDGEKCALIKM